MLQAIGVKSVDELFQDIPAAKKVKGLLNVSTEMSEVEVTQLLTDLGAKNANAATHAIFLGAGAYNHFTPSAVPYLAFRGEFYTAYTPYQAEVSQGTLRAIFEFQTHITELTGLEVSNASVYDGSTALGETIAGAWQVNQRKQLVISKTVHPHYREVIRTYCWSKGVEVVEVGYKDGKTDWDSLKAVVSDKTSAVMVQSPNFFGCIEEVDQAAEIAHAKGAVLVTTVTEGSSLGLLEAPGKLGADFVVGEGQGFGIPMMYGGPYLGFMATKKEYVRTLPGRLVGKTVDSEGKEGYVMTLQAREQHIRRERSVSNICTNTGLIALMATIYLSLVGRQGLQRVAQQSFQKAHYAHAQLCKIRGVQPLFNQPFYNEFALRVPDAKKASEAMMEAGIIPPLDLGAYYPELKNCLLVCCTEMNSKAQIDHLAKVLEGCR